MLNTLLSAIPCNYIYTAYQTTSINTPLTMDGRFIYKGDSEYDKTLKLLSGNDIKEESKEFFDEIGLRKDVLVVKNLCDVQFCFSQGTQTFTSGDALISIDPAFYGTDKHACLFILKHEAFHIKNNDPFNQELIKAIVSTVTLAFSSLNGLSFFSTAALMFSATALASLGYSQFSENRADDLAIAHSSIKEIDFSPCKHLPFSLEFTLNL